MPEDSDLSVSLEVEEVARPQNYIHQRWERRRRFLRFLIREIGFRFLARIERVVGLENIPRSGPTIVMINHIAFIDPFVVMNVYPRNIVPMAKREVYDFPIMGIFPRIWNVIPVERENVDRNAIRMASEILQAGEVILIAPEGTRGPALKEGREGVAFLANRTNAPVLPVAVDQTEGFPTSPFSHRWKGPGASLRFGRPFTYLSDKPRPDRVQLRQMTDEAMIILANLLPEHRRGIYAERVNQPLQTIEWLS